MAIEARTGIVVEQQRLWMVTRRQNKTLRPSRLLGDQHSGDSVGSLKRSRYCFMLLVLTPSDAPLPDRRLDQAMVWLKLYDAARMRVQALGPVVVSARSCSFGEKERVGVGARKTRREKKFSWLTPRKRSHGG